MNNNSISFFDSCSQYKPEASAIGFGIGSYLVLFGAQKIVFKSGICQKIKETFIQCTNYKNESSAKVQRAETLKGVICILTGMSLVAFAAAALNQSSLSQQSDLPQLHEQEPIAKKIFGDEILTLEKNNKPKLLYLSSIYDHNGALKVEDDKIVQNGEGFVTLELGSKSHLIDLQETHDVKYKVISNPKEICSEISLASKIGEVKSLILNGHGSPNSIMISEYSEISAGPMDTIRQLPKDCFAGLSPDAEITLLSCRTGSTPNGIARAIAKMAQRKVWAPSIALGLIQSQFSPHSPAIPTFIDIKPTGPSPWGTTCLFSPDGDYSCSIFITKILPALKKLGQVFVNQIY